MIGCTFRLTVCGGILSTPTQVCCCWQERLNFLFTCAGADNITEHRVANDTKYEHQDIETYCRCSEIGNILVYIKVKVKFNSKLNP